MSNSRSRHIESINNLIKNKKNYYWLKNKNIALFCDTTTRESLKKTTKLLTKNRFQIKKIYLIKKDSEERIHYKNINIPIIEWNPTSTNNNTKIILNNIDAILFNAKGNGLRGDICFNALLKIMEINQKYNKKIVILDQPNPVSKYMEGPGQIPFQHGLTTGELAKYFNQHVLKKTQSLFVVPMIGWKRKNQKEANPEKNLFKILNKIKPINLNIDNKTAATSILFTKDSLTPWEINHLKKICTSIGLNCEKFSHTNKNKVEFVGLKINNIQNTSKFSYFNPIITIANFLKNRKNIKLKYSDSFNKMLASKEATDFLNNDINLNDFKAKTRRTLQDFYAKTKGLMLYKPYPEINNIKIIKI